MRTYGLQKSGHGSLIEGANERWYVVHLCARPLGEKRRGILGRETALQEVCWRDGCASMAENPQALSIRNLFSLTNFARIFSIQVAISIANKPKSFLKATVKGPSKQIKWKSSNKKIATVNSKGKVVVKKTGNVTVTAKANGITAKSTILVKDKKTKKKYTAAKIKKKVQAYVDKNLYKCIVGEEFKSNGRYCYVIRSYAGYSAANVLVGMVSVDPYTGVGIFEPNFGPKENLEIITI